MNFLVKTIRTISGCFLLVFVIFFWALSLWFTTVVEVVTYIETSLARLMKKVMGEDL